MDMKKSLAWVAEGLALVHLAAEFEDKKRFSINNDFIDTLNIRECIQDSTECDTKDWIVSNEEEFRRMVKTYLNKKLEYFYNEGYTYKEGSDYVMFTEEEIVETIRQVT